MSQTETVRCEGTLALACAGCGGELEVDLGAHVFRYVDTWEPSLIVVARYRAEVPPHCDRCPGPIELRPELVETALGDYAAIAVSGGARLVSSRGFALLAGPRRIPPRLPPAVVTPGGVAAAVRAGLPPLEGLATRNDALALGSVELSLGRRALRFGVTLGYGPGTRVELRAVPVDGADVLAFVVVHAARGHTRTDELFAGWVDAARRAEAEGWAHRLNELIQRHLATDPPAGSA